MVFFWNYIEKYYKLGDIICPPLSHLKFVPLCLRFDCFIFYMWPYYFVHKIILFYILYMISLFILCVVMLYLNLIISNLIYIILNLNSIFCSLVSYTCIIIQILQSHHTLIIHIKDLKWGGIINFLICNCLDKTQS